MGLYYLQSRYYDPDLCRFLNADAFVSTGQGELGNNMFAYCRNNPITRTDISGTADYDCLDDSPHDEEDILDIGRGGGGSSLGVHSYYVSGVTQHSNGGNGTGSMIGDSSYIGAKAANSTVVPSWSWGDFFRWLFGNNTSQCFVAGTLVHTAEGTVAIENIQAGDLVWAWDEESGEITLKKVVETYINETTELVRVFVDGEEIITTPSHPFYSPVKGWIEAVQLRAGDILVLLNGEYVVVEKVQHEILEAPISVYNFHVEGYHTYFVSAVGVLVHNTCRTNPIHTPDQRALNELAREIEKKARNGSFISYSEAKLLDEWALEYGVPQHHGAVIGSGKHWHTGWDHTHIYNVHVPFI